MSRDQGRLFERFTLAEVREKARMRRAANRSHGLGLKSQGLRLDDLAGEAWMAATEAFFEPKEEQRRLF